MELIGSALYYILIFPFEFLFEWIMNICFLFLPHGYALILLSLIVNLLTLPIMKWAIKVENKEREKQFHVKQEIIAIKKEYKGEEAFRKTDEIYKKYHYNALLAFKSDLSLFLSIPIFIAAIKTLNGNPEFSNVSFMMIDDLSKPDGLLFGYNLLPFIMTAVNLLSVKLYNNNNLFFDRANAKLIILALLFFVYLYDKSSSLMVYWTSNNIIASMKIFFGYINKHQEGV